MASIFNALHIGYSGLNAAQVGISTTGHNISNAENDTYSRQRVVTTAATPLSFGTAGNIGNGAEIQTVKRIFDNFVFDRYTDTYAQKEYVGFEKATLEQLSTYFPEIDTVGIKADLQKYYDMWQTLADNPDNNSIKLALGEQTELLVSHIQSTKKQVKDLQLQLNDQLFANINEVNALAKELTQINLSIDTAEAGSLYLANDLRDKRSAIERDLSRLIGAEVNTGLIETNIQIDGNSNFKTGSYTVNINGFNIVDGTSFHPIHISNENKNGFYEVSFEREDGVLIPMEESINGGKLGALFKLRGGVVDTTSGMPNDGILQNTLGQLDAFSKNLIENTNNVYAKNATKRMESNFVNINPTNALLSSGLNIKEGSFELVVYDIDGKVTASRTISINAATTMTGVLGSNSIQGQLENQLDDNSDGNATNDIDDFLNFNWATFVEGDSKLELTLDSFAQSKGYTFAIVDKLKTNNFNSGSNFAGALGLNRYFDGKDASSIDLHFDFKGNPTKISAGFSNVAGDNELALSMVQMQYEKFDYKINQQILNATSYGMFDIIATEVGTHTNSAILRNETISTQFNAVELEYHSISKVSIDEEMTNLIKYQTSYGAAAKVITTIDQMMQTLLGIKN